MRYSETWKTYFILQVTLARPTGIKNQFGWLSEWQSKIDIQASLGFVPNSIKGLNLILDWINEICNITLA